VVGNAKLPARWAPSLQIAGRLLSLLIMLGTWSGPSTSAEVVESSAWHHRVAIYLWGAGLDGKTGNRLGSGDIDVDFSF
jgi:hypothetical protein